MYPMQDGESRYIEGEVKMNNLIGFVIFVFAAST
jgi:hypothetical protein